MTTFAALGSTLSTAIPSPPVNEWHLGPFPIRAYALAILAGIVVALWVTSKRWVRRGGIADDVLEIAFWAVPFGIVGGRLYHVITTPQPYWGANGDPIRALYIWEGGLGIWGAVALGAVGAYIGCRRQKVRFAVFADALAPGLLLAQGIGRLGNWFNQELFGAPTSLPWGLRVDDDKAAAVGYPPGTLFQPTFLYEMIWDIAGAGLIVYLERKFRLGHGRVFWLYVLYYTIGRGWIEMLRIDTAEHFLGLRLNVWTSIVVGLGALIAFIIIGRRHPGREDSVYLDPADPRGAAPVDAALAAASTGTEQADAEESDVQQADDPESDPGGSPRGQPRAEGEAPEAEQAAGAKGRESEAGRKSEGGSQEPTDP